MKTISELISHYGSDKNDSGYTEHYANIFDPIREKITSFLEIGIGTILSDTPSTMIHWKSNNVNEYKPGASLRAWRDYFPNAQIYGGDIQEDTQFEEDRIQTFLFNSQKGLECNKILGDKTFDIIIEDGEHTALSQVQTLYNMVGRVNYGGFYIIEDITPGNIHVIKPHLDLVCQLYNFTYNVYNISANLVIMSKNPS